MLTLESWSPSRFARAWGSKVFSAGAAANRGAARRKSSGGRVLNAASRAPLLSATCMATATAASRAAPRSHSKSSALSEPRAVVPDAVVPGPAPLLLLCHLVLSYYNLLIRIHFDIQSLFILFQSKLFLMSLSFSNYSKKVLNSVKSKLILM